MSSISVIIPAYNSAATIVEALDSVLAQTSPADEIIVVDDASTDDTVDVARAWMAGRTDACGLRSVVTLSRNSGPASARNRGVAEATGRWVAFLDADDAWLPWRLSLQRAFVAAHPDVVMCCGGVWRWACRAAWKARP